MDPVMCFCTGETDHAPGDTLSGCVEAPITGKVRAATRPFSDGPARGQPGASEADRTPSTWNARGTCGGCGKVRGVKAVERRTGPTGHPFAGGLRLGVELVMAAHSGCDWTGGPTETTFRPSAELAAFLRDYGRAALAGFDGTDTAAA